MKKGIVILLASVVFFSTFICITGCTKSTGQDEKDKKGETWEMKQLESKDFLHTKGEKICNKENKEITLKGINAGGWLVQEFWMCATKGTEDMKCQVDMINILQKRFGKEKAKELLETYENNYWTEADFDKCKEMGMNVIRLPFTYMNLLDDDNKIKEKGMKKLQWFVEESGKRGMYVILDMHGAPGSQSGVHHTGDTTQGAGFFYGKNKEKNQKTYIKLWEEVAKVFKDNPVVAGYDLLNEPYCDMSENTGKTCWDIYDRAYKAIKKIDAEHIIIMEAKWDPENLPNPKDYNWKNVMYEYHNYAYDDEHNSERQLESIKLKLDLSDYADYKVPVYIGETSFFGDMKAWELGLNELNKRKASWTIWNFKATGDGNNSWGIYNISSKEADIENDSYEEIKRKWTDIKNMVENKKLKKVLEKYYTGYYVDKKDNNNN